MRACVSEGSGEVKCVLAQTCELGSIRKSELVDFAELAAISNRRMCRLESDVTGARPKANDGEARSKAGPKGNCVKARSKACANGGRSGRDSRGEGSFLSSRLFGGPEGSPFR